MDTKTFDGSKCPHCGTIVGGENFIARSTYLWSNGHGYAKRIFCSNCGRWSDYTHKNGKTIFRRWRDKDGTWNEAAKT